jgi:hypothetical protein
MESRLSALERAKQEAERADAAPPDPSDNTDAETSALDTKRTTELKLQYERDLDDQAQKLVEHDNERLDHQWASGQSAAMATAFEAAVSKEHPFKLAGVDCRSATCVARLTYASPEEALKDVDSLMRVHIPTCSGMLSALPPPSGPGEYTRTVIFDCGRKL